MESTGWFQWALLSAFFAALTAVLAKAGLQGVHSDLATLIRTVVIFAVLSIFVYRIGAWTNPLKLGVRPIGFLVASGLATGASWVCYFRALKLGEASRVAPVDKLSVILVALFSVMFLGERPSVRDWTGILLVAMGVTLLSLRK